jgi:hypothetical protein
LKNVLKVINAIAVGVGALEVCAATALEAIQAARVVSQLAVTAALSAVAM